MRIEFYNEEVKVSVDASSSTHQKLAKPLETLRAAIAAFFAEIEQDKPVNPQDKR